MKTTWMMGLGVLVALAGACASDDGGGAAADAVGADVAGGVDVGAPPEDAAGGDSGAVEDAGGGVDSGQVVDADSGVGADSGPGADADEQDAGAVDAADGGAPDDAGPAAVCTPGETRCATGAAVVERCDAGGAAWALDETCAEACVDGACVALVCVPNVQFCDGDTLRACNAQGTAATVSMECTGGCEESATGAACLLCEAGTKGCKDSGTAWECVHPTEPPTETVCASGLEACVAGGCAGLLAWTVGDTAEDAMLWLAIHTGACALDGADAGADLLCWAVDTTKLQAAITAEGFATWLCGGVAGGTLSPADFLPVGAHSVEQIFDAALAAAGCGVPVALELPVGGLQPGHPIGDLCEGYVQATGKVTIAPCP